VSTDEITDVNGTEVEDLIAVLKKDQTLSEKIIYSVLIGNICGESQNSCTCFQ
jgi:hypothetical protein